ncbi:hypothetical protein [Chitinophaga defluvii]|uniref:Lipoprotein n=1 Tax=Chitinophaga defluvii TaxID=3163343 RepID=A0ABV2TEB5_9BACT
MRHISKVIIMLAGLGMAACQSSGTRQEGKEDTAAVDKLVPAQPAGTIQVSFADKDKAVQLVKIRFTIDTLVKEKEFDLAIATGMQDADLYRTVWDKPNSCYIGVIKDNKGVRYFHASQDGTDLKIFHVSTPPKAIWEYVENDLGLGKVTTTGETTNHYQKNFQSGKIIADFIVEVKEVAGKDSADLYTEFGGANKKERVGVPHGFKPVIQLTAEQDHCIFGMMKDDKFEGVTEIRVEKGRLQLTPLKAIIKADAQ